MYQICRKGFQPLHYWNWSILWSKSFKFRGEANNKDFTQRIFNWKKSHPWGHRALQRGVAALRKWDTRDGKVVRKQTNSTGVIWIQQKLKKKLNFDSNRSLPPASLTFTPSGEWHAILFFMVCARMYSIYWCSFACMSPFTCPWFHECPWRWEICSTSIVRKAFYA